MTTKIKAGVIEAGAISTASLADTSITAAKLAGTLDLTGKTVTVATATAGDNDTTVASTAFVTTAIANLTDSAPAALDTLNELSAALNDDADFSTTVTNSIALKAPLASPTFTGDATFDTDTLVIDSTNNRVGIGTTSPDVKLHLEDASRVDIKFEKTGSETHYIRKDGDFLRFRGHDDNTVLFELKNNTDGLNVCSFPAGNLGIGTTTPSAEVPLTVYYSNTSQFHVGGAQGGISNNVYYN